jgi:8-oxo-dGTP pyrophosphatase MutT (NUDIX family)
MLEFGEKLEGVKYRELPCARLVIKDADGKFAFVEVGDQYFLIGGEIKKGESESRALIREAQEEIGAEVMIGKKIGMAGDYLYARRISEYIHKTNSFYEAQIAGEPKGGTEPNHRLIWATLDEANQKIRQRSHFWALEQVIAE